VTLVTRGADLFHATHLHRLLQALLGLAAPCYRHHMLLTSADGRRLAKRDGSLTVRALRAPANSAGGARHGGVSPLASPDYPGMCRPV